MTARPELELRRLRAFVVLAEELNFGRAAERLHMTQPALSAQPRQLEQRLDFQLLERSSRRAAALRVVLSQSAARLWPQLLGLSWRATRQVASSTSSAP